MLPAEVAETPVKEEEPIISKTPVPAAENNNFLIMSVILVVAAYFISLKF